MSGADPTCTSTRSPKQKALLHRQAQHKESTHLQLLSRGQMSHLDSFDAGVRCPCLCLHPEYGIDLYGRNTSAPELVLHVYDDRHISSDGQTGERHVELFGRNSCAAELAAS